MFASAAPGSDFDLLCADRAAIERVYYKHRLGEKPPFAEALPPAALENLVRLDLRKEAALQRTYGVRLTPAQVAAEVQRINTTTQAPEMLAEMKAALGGDAARFGRAFAKPILVERELRRRFDWDTALHGPQRRELERVRTGLTNAAATFRSRRVNEALTGTPPNELVGKLLALLKQDHSDAVREATWHLGPRPKEKPAAPTLHELEIKKRFGPDAQIISPPRTGPGQERKFYFEHLPAELQQLLRAQLRRTGDVSQVIEMPGGFLLYLAKEKTAETLTVAVLSLRKRSYEEWLAEQNKREP